VQAAWEGRTARSMVAEPSAFREWWGDPMTVKHATASTFVFSAFPGGWQVGVIMHPRLGWAMVPGGHVEADETPAEAAAREVAEETGLAGIRLIQPLAPGLPDGFPHERVAPPWWITELRVPADNHLAEPHVHVDHRYLAVAPDPEPASAPAHPFAWHTGEGLQALDMPEDTKLLAKMLFEMIDDLAAGRTSAVAGLIQPGT
jgi:8-oxo-dGTP pyrophosphatase MutT (NUDIX family)